MFVTKIALFQFCYSIKRGGGRADLQFFFLEPIAFRGNKGTSESLDSRQFITWSPRLFQALFFFFHFLFR